MYKCHLKKKKRVGIIIHYTSVWKACFARFPVDAFFFVGPTYSARDLQVQNSIIFSLKLDLTALFTHLSIILLQYFQFLVISGI